MYAYLCAITHVRHIWRDVPDMWLAEQHVCPEYTGWLAALQQSWL